MSTVVVADKVVSIEYTLTNADGEVLDASKGDPLTYLHGHHNIVPGLEEALAGRAVGDAFDVAVPPRDGYGESRPDAVQVLPLSAFGGERPPVGAQFATRTPKGVVPLWVTQVSDAGVEVTFDHPLAGETLHFAVTIHDVRDATAEELEHGHPHGPGGHHH